MALNSIFTLAAATALSFLLFTISSTSASEILNTKVDPDPEVTISNGILRGRWQTSRDTANHKARSFASYEGIRYATAVRFEQPKPAGSWTGVRNATAPGSKCPQTEGINGITHNLTEDCLFANVYVPKLEAGKEALLPVMVWIHGGSFVEGSGSAFGPNYLMEQNVVLVTINYRLGVFGFLNIHIDGLAWPDMWNNGNLGLKDMIMALKWVQTNIKNFGGDPGSVTIFGESAGGAAVHDLMLSPAATGLFHKAISHSGTALCSLCFTEYPLVTAVEVTTALNCDINGGGIIPFPNFTAIVNCMRKKTIQEILNVQPNFNFAPGVDIEGQEFSVLPDTPRRLTGHPWKNSSAELGIPFMIGYNEQEGLISAGSLVSSNESLKNLNENWRSVFGDLFGYSDYGNRDEISLRIREFYFNDTNSDFTAKDGGTFGKLFTDAFVKEIKRTALLTPTYNDHVYGYQLTYRGNFSVMNFYGLPAEGPTHSDELQYFFNSLTSPIQNWPDLPSSSIDEEFSVNLTTLWASFARDGKPTGFGEIWNPISKSEIKDPTDITTVLRWYNLQKDAKHVAETTEYNKRLAFWETAYDYPPDTTTTEENSANNSMLSGWLTIWLTIILYFAACA